MEKSLEPSKNEFLKINQENGLNLDDEVEAEKKGNFCLILYPLWLIIETKIQYLEAANLFFLIFRYCFTLTRLLRHEAPVLHEFFET